LREVLIVLLRDIAAAVPLLVHRGLEINSYRSLHDTRRARTRGGAEGCARLSYNGCASISGRGARYAGAARIYLYDAISQLRINVPEIRAIENVVDLPPQLNLALLTQLDVLEHRDVIIEN
jgi:hypothetical protein